MAEDGDRRASEAWPPGDRPRPEPWSGGGKIPWHDPAFSRRMLDEHLSQSHDRASRRFETVDRQVAWLHEVVLQGRPSRILDLGCGPGLYTERLARAGHPCTGIDFSPASIAYARRRAGVSGLSCVYVEADLREVELEGRFNLVLLLFGELNAFPRHEILPILRAARAALEPSGELLVELSTLDGLRRSAARAPVVLEADSGLFSDHPYRCVLDAYFDRRSRTLTERYTIQDCASGELRELVSTAQGYTRAGAEALFAEAGLGAPRWRDDFPGSAAHGLRVVRLSRAASRTESGRDKPVGPS